MQEQALEPCPMCQSYRTLPPQSEKDEITCLKHFMTHGLSV